MKKTAYLLLLLLFSVSACVRPEKVEIRGLENVTLGAVGSSNVRLHLFINAANRSNSDIVLKNLQFELFEATTRKQLLEGKSATEIQLKKRFDGTLEVPVNVRISGGILNELAVMSRIESNDPSLHITASVTIKQGLFSKKFRIREMSLPEFLRWLENLHF